MARIKSELTNITPNLAALGISQSALERYRVVEASTNLGRRIAIPYLKDCVKLLSWDGSAVWDGEYVPEAGLFGQREATSRTFVLVAHEFEALKLASIIENYPELKHLHAVALPYSNALGRLGASTVVDSFKVVASEVYIWGATLFDSMVGAFESFVSILDEAGSVSVQSLPLSRLHSPLDMDDASIVKVLKGPRSKWSPTSLISAHEIFENADFFKKTFGFSSGIDGLDRYIRKLRLAELVMLVAGTGVGKSTLLRQIIYNLAFREGLVCAVAFLEETQRETLIKFACIHYGIPFETLADDPGALSADKWDEFINQSAIGNIRFINQSDASGGFGGMDVDVLLNTVRYLKRKEGVDFVAIDHLSIMISGKESSREGERKDIDIMMTKLATACVMLEVGIIGVCHLSNPDGTPHEEGGRVLLRHMRGSGSLKQLSWCVIAQERNQQAGHSRLVLLRVLKNRNGGGRTGLAAALEYNDPLLVERPDIDLHEMAANMAGEAGPRAREKREPPAPKRPPSNPFDDKPGRRVTFGKLPEEN